jgi:hypothetical protein
MTTERRKSRSDATPLAGVADAIEDASDRGEPTVPRVSRRPVPRVIDEDVEGHEGSVKLGRGWEGALGKKTARKFS